MDNWNEILKMLRNPEFNGVHKIYAAKQGFGHITTPNMLRVRITGKTHIGRLTQLLHNCRLGKKIGINDVHPAFGFKVVN